MTLLSAVITPSPFDSLGARLPRRLPFPPSPHPLSFSVFFLTHNNSLRSLTLYNDALFFTFTAGSGSNIGSICPVPKYSIQERLCFSPYTTPRQSLWTKASISLEYHRLSLQRTIHQSHHSESGSYPHDESSSNGNINSSRYNKAQGDE